MYILFCFMYGCWLVLPSVLQHSCPHFEFILSHFLLYLLCCKAEIIIIISALSQQSGIGCVPTQSQLVSEDILSSYERIEGLTSVGYVQQNCQICTQVLVHT